MTDVGFWQSVRREINNLGSQWIYAIFILIIPILTALFFVGILEPGLPVRVPVAVVDMDHSTLSRAVTRNLNSTELVDIVTDCETFDQAMTEIRSGNIYGFIVIPDNFERDAISGRNPSLEYYNNLTFFVPGTLSFKGFKTIAVTMSGGMVRTQLVSLGVPEQMTDGLLQPVAIADHPIGNPWMSYNIYLAPSFTFGTLALLIMLITAWSITMEIKDNTSVDWLQTAKGHISVAVTAKLLPQFILWSVVGQFCIALLFGFNHFPCGNIWAIVGAMELFIIASQAMGLLFSSAIPNPRLALSLCSLIGVLTFSLAAFSFPVESMYGWIASLANLLPARYMFLIYIKTGLDGFPIYYARMMYVALLVFPLVAATMLWRLKRFCLHPVYVP